VVVRVISSGPGLMTLLVTFLVGAATALVVQLVVQLYVVPKVETRKRREVEHPGFRAHLVLCGQLRRVGCCCGEVIGPEPVPARAGGLTWGGGP
jgi:hypothetical protein